MMTTGKYDKPLVPKLRFPEFRDDPEWHVKELADKKVACFVKDKVPAQEVELGSYVSTENILPNFFGITAASKKPEKGSLTLYEVGDILIANIRPYLEKIWVATGRGGASNDVLVVSPSEIDARLLSYLLKNSTFIAYVMRGAKGVKMPRGDIDLIKRYPVSYPGSEAEQQKIADCLTSLDERIQATRARIDALKAHKKGLMQQLFPTDGATTPQRRFPEFHHAGEWGETTIKDVCDLQAGNFVKAGDIHNDAEDFRFPCYGGNGLRGYVETYTHTGNYPLIGRQGAQCGNVNLATGTFHATEHAVVATAKPNIHGLWLYYLLVTLRLNQYATGQAQPGLSVGNLKNIQVSVPNDEAEQQKIADCLSSLDELIAATTAQRDALGQHKKGLMQQLFPALDEAVA